MENDLCLRLFLGGQPGAGKLTFVDQDDVFLDFIKINDDEYRKFHPYFKEIATYDIDNMPERTQSFVNECVERLINDLSDEGYNLIIEGTLRNPQITISTCNQLKERADGCEKWNSEFEDTADAFIETKMEILQAQRRKRGR